MSLATVTLDVYRRGEELHYSAYASWIARDADGNMVGLSLMGPSQAVVGLAAATISRERLAYDLPEDADDGGLPAQGILSPSTAVDHWRQFRQRLRLDGIPALHLVSCWYPTAR